MKSGCLSEEAIERTVSEEAKAKGWRKEVPHGKYTERTSNKTWEQVLGEKCSATQWSSVSTLHWTSVTKHVKVQITTGNLLQEICKNKVEKGLTFKIWVGKSWISFSLLGAMHRPWTVAWAKLKVPLNPRPDCSLLWWNSAFSLSLPLSKSFSVKTGTDSGLKCKISNSFFTHST